MKNLALLTCVNASIPKFGNEDVYLAADSDTGRLYFNSATDIVGVDPSLDEETFAIGLEELAEGDVKVAGIQFLQGEESLCVATKHGDLLLVNVHTKSVEVVGSVESGLTEMRWSPDQELILLATGHDTVIAMTREFDPVAEMNIHAEEFGEGEFINVGWGKKETQFHGSEGKGAAAQKKETIAPALPWDGRKTRIVWRGDGQNFAVSMIDPHNGNRKFRVWNRECVLQYTSEYMNGLESAFAWRPSGNVLASSQRKPHRHDIVFFEKNGLQHGEFTLPFDKDEMKINYLEWNSDSSVLAIWLTTLQLESDGNSSAAISDCVQLWTMSNYHWYLKQSLQFEHENCPALVQWDCEQSHKLHILCKNGQYRQFVFTKVVHDSNLPVLCKEDENSVVNGDRREEKELSFVAVIDGKNVLMTPFKAMVVPPPMCAYKLQLPSEANAIAFCASECFPNDIAVVMKNNELACFTIKGPVRTKDKDNLLTKLSTKLDAAGGNGFNPQVSPHVPSAVLQIEADCQDSIVISALHHWIWLNSSQMFAISPGTFPGTDYAVLFEIDHSAEKLCARTSTEIEGLVLSVHMQSSDCVALQLQDGTMLKCHIPSLEITPYMLPSGQELKLQRPCLQVANCTFNSASCIIGLSEHSRLYMNETEIASDCSSFCLHDDFLFMTTHAHQLRCISRNVALEDILKYFTTPIEGRSLLQNCAVIETHRALERGSKIVTVTPSDSRLILQMPRGNLELIHPRCLVLSLVTRFIKSLKYGEAFTVMKRHRINVNLLYDVDKQWFEANVGMFISELSSTTNINIFIGGLQDEDLTKTMYKQYFLSENTEMSISTTLKTNRICDSLIREMEKDERRFLMSLVTAHVKKQPSEVGQALKRIKNLADSIGHEEKLIVDTLKYMTVLVDGNTLFNEALGTYDFKLVLMVAEKSQLDPKEFLPMLKELQQLEENYRKYKIDVNLRRYESALTHVAKCDDYFDECMDLITKHEMYKQAMKLFNEGSERYNTICHAYGEFLASKHKNEEAGIVFLRCQEMKKALECFTNSKNYSLALSTAYKLKLEKGEIVELAYKLAEKAKTSGHHLEAVEILEYHAQDVELAIETALHAYLWPKAIRIAEQHQRNDLIETHVIPSIKEAHDATCQSLESHRDLIVKHSNRLETVRQLKEKQRMQALLDGVEGIGLDSDLYSDTSSTMAGSVTSRQSSTASRSSGRTSKSRKKKERKAYSLKEGSKFEDLALLLSLKTTIKAVNELADDVRSLAVHLSLLRFDDLAEKVQVLYIEVRSTVSQLIPTIWSQSMLQNDQVATGPQSTVNSIVASMQNRRAPVEQTTSGEGGRGFADLDVFIPPKFEISASWTMNMYSE